MKYVIDRVLRRKNVVNVWVKSDVNTRLLNETRILDVLSGSTLSTVVSNDL